MEVHAVDVDNVCGFFERLLDIAVFPNTIPDFVGASFFMEDAAIFERLFCIDHRVERFVLYCDQFSGIVGEGGRLCYDGGYGLSLIARFLHYHGIITNLLSVLGADFDKRLGLRGDFLAGDRTYHAGQGFCGGCVDTDDARMRVGRAHETQVEHLVQLDIVGEFAAAAEETVFFLAREGCAYPVTAAVLFFFTQCACPPTVSGRGRPLHTRTTSALLVERRSISELVSCLAVRAGRRLPRSGDRRLVPRLAS